MKIRTDFVTNSSSCSYTCWQVKSKELAEYVKQFLNGNKDYDGTYFPIKITVEGDIVSCEDESGEGNSIDEVYDYACYDAVSIWFYSDIKENMKKMEDMFKYEDYDEDDDESYDDEDDEIIFEDREDCIAGIVNSFDEAAYNYSPTPYGEWDLEKIEEIMNKPETKIIESDSASVCTD